jgi:hypothetical protein
MHTQVAAELSRQLLYVPMPFLTHSKGRCLLMNGYLRSVMIRKGACVHTHIVKWRNFFSHSCAVHTVIQLSQACHVHVHPSGC